MTEEQILELAGDHFCCNVSVMEYSGRKEDLLKFARAIIEEHEKDRKHNLGEDEYFNSWRN
jgi:hypothetical protein